MMDNSAEKDLNRAITWQFDGATRLVGIISMLKSFFSQSVETLYDGIIPAMDLSDKDAVNDFSLAVWGKLLGVPRPMILADESDPETAAPMSSELYRRVLLARFRLMNSNASPQAYRDFVTTVFGDLVAFMDGEDMSISFSFQKVVNLTDEEKEMRNALLQVPDSIFAYPAGVKSSEQDDGPVFGFAEQVRPSIGGDGQTVDVGYEQTVGTTVKVRISGTAGTEIPATAYFTNNSNKYMISEAVDIGEDGYVDAMFTYSGKDYVEARSVYELSDIGDISVSVTNERRSATDFTVAGLDESTIAWERKV